MRQYVLARDRRGDVGDDRRDLLGLHAAARDLLPRPERDRAGIERRVLRRLAALRTEGVDRVEHIVLAHERRDHVAGQRALGRDQQRLIEADLQQLVQERAEAQHRLHARGWRLETRGWRVGPRPPSP